MSMNGKRSSGPDVGAASAARPPFTASRYHLVMAGCLVAVAAYWFLFILGGTFDPAKRACLRKTMDYRKTAPTVSKTRPSNKNTKHTDAKTRSYAANMKPDAVASNK